MWTPVDRKTPGLLNLEQSSRAKAREDCFWRRRRARIRISPLRPFRQQKAADQAEAGSGGKEEFRSPATTPPALSRLAGGRVDGARRIRPDRLQVGADCCDRKDDSDRDQADEQRIFDQRGAVFFLAEFVVELRY
jgi:hypothetical protein